MKRKNVFSVVISLLLVVSFFTTMAMESYQAKDHPKKLVKNVPDKVISVIKGYDSGSQLENEDIEVYLYKPLKKNLALINYECKNFCYTCDIYTETIGEYIYCCPSCPDMVDVIDFSKRTIYSIKEAYKTGKIKDKDLKKISKCLADYQEAQFVKPKLSVSKKTLKKGESFKLKVKVPDCVYLESTKWSSSDKSVAKVNQNGKVTALKKGKATISVKYNGRKLKCKITVKGKAKKKK